MRRLALFCLGFAVATIASVYFINSGAVVCAVASAVLSICVTAIAVLKKNRKSVSVFLFIIWGVFFGFLSFFINYRNTVEVIKSISFNQNTYILVETESITQYDSYAAVNGTILDIDLDENTKISLQGMKIRINIYEERCKLKPGDIFYFSAKLEDTGFYRGEKSFSSYANGIFLKCSCNSPTVVNNRGYKYIPEIINNNLSDKIDKVFSAETKGFAKALMLGDKGDLYAERTEYKDLQRSGLSHTVAVSGLHVTMAAGVLIYLFGNSKKSNIICILIVWLFVLVTGGSPSAVRAGIMLTSTMIAPIFKREGDSLTSLLFALALILVNNPYSIAGTGLQFSFAATAGLVLLSKPINMNFTRLSEKLLPQPVEGMVRGIASIACASLAVFIFTAPLSVIHFGSINIYSLISNILCLWAVTAAFTLGYISTAVSFFFLPLGKLAVTIPEALIGYIHLVCGKIARLPGALLHYNSLFGVIILILTYVVIVYFFLLNEKARKKLKVSAFVIIIALVCLSVFSYTYTKNKYKESPGYFTAVDVGQGQCLALYCGDKTLVIDCGTGDNTIDAAERCDAALSSAFREKIDILICTHFDSDHVNFIKDLIEYSKVDIIMLPQNAGKGSSSRDDIIKCAIDNNVEVFDVTTDISLDLDGGNNHKMKLDIVAPQGREDNEGSLFINATVGNSSVLVTGDAPQEIEREYINARGQSLSNVDILIAGHHGSRYSTGVDLLTAANPSIVIISVGYNKYGHPSDEVIERLTQIGAEIYRTDLCGNIEIELK